MIHLAAVISLSTVSPAQPAGTSLVWQWAEGDRRVYAVEVETSQSSDDGETESETTASLEFDVTQDVRSVDGTGVASVDQTVGPVRATVTADAGKPIRADGSKPDPYAGLKPAQRQLVEPYIALGGSVTTFEIDRDGVVRSASGGLGEDAINAALQQIVGGTGQGGLATPSHIQQSLALIPNRTVSRGETWSTTIRQPLPLMGELVTEITCRLAGTVSTVAGRTPRIAYEGTMRFQPVQLGGLFTITLESGTIRGDLAFDSEAGQIVTMTSASEMTWRIESLAGLLGDEASTQTMTMSQTGSWRLSE